MKKRLLSAALALAMALTLLPVSVFAATTTGVERLPSAVPTYTNSAGQTVYRYNTTTGVTVTVSQYLGQGPADGRTYGEWYWLDNQTDPQNPVYYKVTSGIVMGTAQNETVTSGQWWADLNAFTNPSSLTSPSGKTLRSTNFTILGNTSIDMSADTWASNSLQVFFAGAGSFTVPSSITSLTVNTTNVANGTRGTVRGLEKINRSAYATTAPGTSNVTLNATNVVFSSIGLIGRSNSVTLTNCSVGAIYMSGYTVTNNSTPAATAYNLQRLTVNGSTVTGAIEVIGDGSQVTLTSTSVSGADKTLKVTGHGGAVNIAGSTNVGAITVKSRAANSTDTANGNIPTVNVTGGTVAGIAVDAAEQYASATGSSFTVSRGTTGPVNITGAITTNKGSLTVANSSITTATVKEGTVTLTGPVTSSGVLTLGALGKVNLGISGTGMNLNGITVDAGKGENLNITSWPTDRSNYYGTLTLNDYAKGQINGGTFACPGTMPFGDAQSKAWINTTNLTYRAFLSGKVALYKADELARAIQDIGQTDVQTPGNLMPIGQTATNTLTFKWGNGSVAKMGFSVLTPVILPTELGSQKIATWMWMDVTNPASPTLIKSLVPGQSYNFPAQDITLVADGTTEDIAIINKITGGIGTDASNNIRATVNGTTITLTGAVPGGLSGVTGIYLDLTTDAVDSAGNIIKLTGVPVDFNNSTKATEFGTIWAGQNGARTEGGKLVLSNGTAYTVNGSGLAVSAPNLRLVDQGTNGYPIEVNVGGKLAGWDKDSKDKLIKLLNDNPGNASNTGMKVAADCKAWAQAINAAQATITSTQTVESWRDNARNTVWTQGYKSPNSTHNTAVNGYAVSGGYSFVKHSGSYAQNAAAADKTAIGNAFAYVYIVPYLQVNVTDYDAGNGTLEATLVPSYRVEVSADTYNKDFAYVAQQSRALSNLTGEMGAGITVKFNLGAKFASQKMHQDGKYVYAGTSGAWTITHAGGTGLGSVVINGDDGLITLTQPTGVTKNNGAKYDSIQAAVDDTVPQKTTGGTTTYSTVTIDSKYNKPCPFDMTGVARTIKVVANGNQTVSCTSNYVDAPQVSGMTYTFQLKRDTVATGNVDIAANTAQYGAITVSASKAKTGDVITITATPNQGYKVNTITAATNTGAAVAVSATGTLNQYTLTVPANTTKVTVTPTFVVGDNKATFSVNSNTRGTASVYTGTSDGKVEQGKSATVTVIPTSGNRTMGLTAYGNNGATAPVSRTGTNSFNVTVPSGATTVTVTPSFDVDNGTPFSDVLSNHWASNEISWAYRHGYTSGKDTAYTYKPADYITRGEVVAMLWKAANSPVVNYANPFKDVPTNYWAYNAVMWAASKGLIDTSTGYFNGTGYINRADTVVILYKHANSPTVYGTSGFADVASNAYYSRAVTWARQQGLTNGYSGNTYFRPSYAISRAEVATFLYRAFG